MSNKNKTIENKISINDLLVDSVSLIDRYTCSICFEFIYKFKIPLQCKSGCWNCESCWTKHLETNNNKQCPQCRCDVKSIGDLSRNRFIENEFGFKLAYCPNSFKLNTSDDGENKAIKDDEEGCKEVINVNKLDTHIKECNYRFVKCKFNGCDEIFRFNQIDKHEVDCNYRQEVCMYCKKDDIIYKRLKEHYSVCPSKPIPCEHCNKDIERNLMDDHLSLECSESILPCKYSDVGCTHKTKRSELNDHLNTTNHSIFIEKKLYLQSELISKLTNIIDEQNKKYTELSNKFEKHERLLDNIYNEYLKKDELHQVFPNIDFKYQKKWCIINYLKTIEGVETGQSIKSPTFFVGNYQFQVQLTPMNKDNYLSLFLYLKDAEKRINVTYSLSLINHKDPNLTLAINSNKIFNTYPNSGPNTFSGWGRHQTIKSNEISIEEGWLNDFGEMVIEYSAKVN